MNDEKKIVNQYEYPGFMASALAIHGSVTPKVLKQVLFAVLYGALISVISLYIPALTIPISPFEYAGLLMGLILVFRINAGYDRWWEARKLWGSVVNTSRNLAIIVTNYIPSKREKSIEQLIQYIAAMPYLMKNNLRLNTSVDEVEHLLDKSTIAALKNIEHKPNYISSRMAACFAKLLAENNINQFSYLKAEECRQIIIDCQGALERILKTPMPFVMAIKSRRFILLFLIILPIALVNYSVYISPMVTGLVAYGLLSLDQIGVELQNPFCQTKLSHLPLGEICKTIEKNVTEIYQKAPPLSGIQDPHVDIASKVVTEEGIRFISNDVAQQGGELT
ncbi:MULTISPECIES: bestrophin family protein [unclassified Legionella]|uniref:bestrophin family protein n=1 Tax=unclassified Legionella TaxID=2622702 RepID=UPI001055F724|nr:MULTISPECIES: bestrophin family ion channel [unclassified Legionella]MDI9818109.1 bestrophin family ion channel [Legionella sp. PL877]